METKDRKTLLENTIDYFVRQGFLVYSQTEDSVQLVRPKRFSFLLALIFLLLYGFPLLLYVLYYLSRNDEALYIRVDGQGTITAINQDGASHVVSPDQPESVPAGLVPPQEREAYSTSTKIMIGIILLLVAFWVIFAILRF